MSSHNTREAWLLAAVDKMRPMFADQPNQVPEHVLVSFGWAKRAGGKAIGWCYKPAMTEGGASTILISPVHAADDPVTILGTLLHELVHAADGGVNGHKAPFARVVKALGLTGKPTATVVGDELRPKLEVMAKSLGPLPHKTVSLMSSVGAQTNRQLKIECANRCGYKLRGSKKIIELGLPNCPVCDVEMEEAL